ncbi:5-formyltetrahydrofolate cyclo-ligase [Buchnera aphidicola]|nr:5-formyltetrahydrofolate cyclo-ligase [Buchnera aphidicola]
MKKLTKLCNYRRKIRENIRNLRKSLTVLDQRIASMKVSKIAFNFNFFCNSKNIALFIPFDGELDTYPLILRLWLNNYKTFVPVIKSRRNKKMIFVRFSCNSILYRNKYNILEPFYESKDIISDLYLDIIIVPLVAFDQKGSRLGMGGGFYDFFLMNWCKKKFFIMGLAYDFQYIRNIPTKSWDVPLPIVLTPNNIWIFKNM